MVVFLLDLVMAGSEGSRDCSSIWVREEYVPLFGLLIVDAVLLGDREVRVVFDFHPGVVEERFESLCFFLCDRDLGVESFGASGFDALDRGLELGQRVVFGDRGEEPDVMGELVADVEDVALGHV